MVIDLCRNQYSIKLDAYASIEISSECCGFCIYSRYFTFLRAMQRKQPYYVKPGTFSLPIEQSLLFLSLVN